MNNCDKIYRNMIHYIKLLEEKNKRLQEKLNEKNKRSNQIMIDNIDIMKCFI